MPSGCYVKSFEQRKKISESMGKYQRSVGRLPCKLPKRPKIKGAPRGRPKGYTMSIEHRIKLSNSLKGCKAPNWRGGKKILSSIIRNSLEYRLWRESVFTRDNFTCKICNKRGVKLNADHIKPFALFPELRMNIDNGRTLCVECHRNTDTFGNRMFKMMRK